MSRSFKPALVAILLLGLAAPCSAALDEVAKTLESGEPGSAIAQLLAMPASERESYRGRLLYAGALAAQGKRKEAAKIYHALIEDAPELPEPYNNLAVLYAADGHLDKALKLLEQAMKTSASYATVRDNLGRVYLEMSLNSYAKALQVDEREKPPTLQVLYALNGRTSPSTESLETIQVVEAAKPGTLSAVEDGAQAGAQKASVLASETRMADPAEAAMAEPESVVQAAADPEPAAPAVVESGSTVLAMAIPEPVVLAAVEPDTAQSAEVEAEQAVSAAEPTPAGRVAVESEAGEPVVAVAEPVAPVAAEPEQGLEPESAGVVLPVGAGTGSAQPQKSAVTSPETSTDTVAEQKLVNVPGNDPAPVLKAVQQWAQSWQKQDIEAYLAAYAEGFTPSHGLSREQWRAQRRLRLSKPEQIEVELEGLSVVFHGPGRARVSFLQHYRSNRYRDKTRKSLQLVHEAGAWRILAEKTLEVIQ